MNTFIIMLRAPVLASDFNEKSFAMRCSTIKRWLVAHSMCNQMSTHIVQHVPAKVVSKALNYMIFMRCIDLGSNHD